MSDVAIGRLTLRLTGVTPERARAIARLIARGLAGGAHELTPKQREQASVHVPVGQTDGDEQTALRIARVVLAELGGAS